MLDELKCPKCGNAKGSKLRFVRKPNGDQEIDCLECTHIWSFDKQAGETPTGTTPPSEWDGSEFTSEKRGNPVVWVLLIGGLVWAFCFLGMCGGQ